MSLWRDELKPSPATSACLVALGAVTVASLGQIIDSPDHLVWSVPAVVVGAGFALFFGYRSLGLGLALMVGANILASPVLFAQGAAERIPSGAGFAAVRELISAGLAAIPRTTPPVPAEREFLILAWGALVLLGFLGAAWVVVRRPVGAVVSALAVVTFAGSVGDGTGRTFYALAAVACTGAFFLSEGRHRIARWGGSHVPAPGWLGLPTLAVACVVAFAAPIVLGETPILRLQSTVQPRVVIIKPLSDIRRQLHVDPPLEVMRVTSDQATYWRLTALDSYDGAEWVLEARPRDVRDGSVPPADPHPQGEVLEQSYRLTSLLAPWLPAVYSAELIGAQATVQVDEGSQTLLLRDETEPGLTYQVVSRLPRVEQNLPADPVAPNDARAERFGALAAPIAEGARTPLDIARRLETHFRTFTYDEDVPAGHTVERLEQFLVDQRGYCEQFAATMTLMLRGLGVEARVGVGFLPGALSGDEYVVSTRDAHAWVEANIPGAGWFAFDPTPGRADASSVPPELQEAPAEPEPVPEETPQPLPTPVPTDPTEDLFPLPAGGGIPRAVLWTLLGLAVVGSVPSAKAVRRSRRRRGPPGSSVLGAYAEMVDVARDLGWRADPSETQREFARRALGGSEDAVRLAGLASRALYATGGADPGDTQLAWSAQRRAGRALRGRAPRWRRMLALFDPRTFVPDGSSVRSRLGSLFPRLRAQTPTGRPSSI